MHDEAQATLSGSTIVKDAPASYGGIGESFSSKDTTAVVFSSCVIIAITTNSSISVNAFWLHITDCPPSLSNKVFPTDIYHLNLIHPS